MRNRILYLICLSILTFPSISFASTVLESEEFVSSDFSELSLRDFEGAASSGSTGNLDDVGIDLNRDWEEGDQIEDVLTAGDIQDLGGQLFTLAEVEELSGVSIGEMAIGESSFLLENALSGNIDSLDGKDIDEISTTLLGDVPELTSQPIQDLLGWEDQKIANIPGLADIPLGTLPFSGLPTFIPLARLDQVWSEAEGSSSFKVISGGEHDGYSAECKQKRCSYIELSDIAGRNGSLKGARWIKGGKDADKGEQLVPGGRGILRRVFNGKEPTGRPLGRIFKLVLTDVDETTGSAQFGVSMQFCKKFLGCTPRGFGPWKIPLTVQEKDVVFLGIESNKKNPAKIEPPQNVKEAVKKARKRLNISGDSSTNSVSSSNNTCQVNLAANSNVDAGTIHQVLQYGKEKELSEGQTAFLLSYAESNGRSLSLDSSYGHKRILPAERSDLVAISNNNGRFEGLRPEAAEAWNALLRQAKDSGIVLHVGDTYRTIDDQRKLFNNAVEANGGSQLEAAKTSAPPGYSEHHSGYAIDIRGSDGLLTRDKDPAAYAFLQNVAPGLGFEQSFDGSGSVSREDWHWRFIGTQQAKAELGLTSDGGESFDDVLNVITPHINKNKADFFQAGQQLNASNSSDIANRASDYQATLQDCYFASGGECDGNFVNPMPGGYFTSPFGMRLHPITGIWRLHAGVDTSGGGGLTVRAACSGEVINATWESGYGNVVLLRHGDLVTRYAHLQRQLVRAGDHVSKGQPIGIEGNTGAGTAAHLHTELREGDIWGTPIDPATRIPF